MYDLIGDIHGYAEQLKSLLKILGYTDETGPWQHPQRRKVIFVGDYIDRGPAIRETLQIVKGMTDSGNAIALMGNHEYNALAYHYTHQGIPLRKHNAKHRKQHQATLAEFWDYREEWDMYVKWFYTLPLFFDDGQIRAVHAYWDESHTKWLKANNYTTITEQLLIDSHLEGVNAYTVINDILKGTEIKIEKKCKWRDKDGHWRTENRVKWWMDASTRNYGECIFNCPKKMKDMRAIDIQTPAYPATANPLFVGHYWLDERTPVILTNNVSCLDYSIAKEDAKSPQLVAYRWNGETVLNNLNFVNVKKGDINKK